MSNLMFDAFDAAALTAAINSMSIVPTTCGERVFNAVMEGVAVTEINIELRDNVISRVDPKIRGNPAGTNSVAKSKLLAFSIPHFPLEDTVNAESLQDKRMFGTTQPLTIDAHLRDVLQHIRYRFELTWESLRLSALRGRVVGSNGVVLADVFESFGLLNSEGYAAPERFSFALDNRSLTNDPRQVCHRVQRYMRRALSQLQDPPKGKIWALCGDNFFDALVSHPTIKDAYAGTEAAAERLGGNYSARVFEYAGIFFENYIGNVEENTFVPDDECMLFWTGVENCYAEYYAPADFLETVNKKGLPIYIKITMGELMRFAKLHAQSNPLPLCLRPKTLARGTLS